MNLPITKNGVVISHLPIYNNMLLTRELMGAKELRADIELPDTLISPIGSQITVKGEKYTINTPPLSVTKLSNYKYAYSVMFESVLYRLYDKQIKQFGNRTFPFYCTPTTLAQFIVDQINTIDSGWTVGLCDDLPAKIIQFNGHSCRTSLDLGAEGFGIEWKLGGADGKELTFTKQVGNITTLVFEYGRGKGLYSLRYEYQNDKNVVTRAYGYGGSKNLPAGYRGLATQLTFGPDGYLDKNVFMPDGVTPLYGIKEGDYINEDIYPEVNGVVTAASEFDEEVNTFTISASALDFDLNDYFNANEPQLSFKTGELQGENFRIRKYDHDTRTITLDVFEDKQGNRLPRLERQPSIGDTFYLFDMDLPDEVIQDAEDRLQAATQEWLNENCIPRVKYSLEIDPLYLRDNAIDLHEGDKIRVIDAALGIDEMIRITKLQMPPYFPEMLTPETRIICEIANFIPYTTTERVIAATIDNKNQIVTVDRTASERSRLNSADFRKLASRMFDPDGNLVRGQESLFAAFLQVGFDSQNFELPDVTISTMVDNNPNKFTISAGHLTHNIYEVPGLGYEWTFESASWAALDPDKFYYVYAKASKTSLAGTWEISESPVFVNDIPGYWAFNIGQLFEYNSDVGFRRFKFTKGVTNIVGNMIDTGTLNAELVNVINLHAESVVAGILASTDGQTKFDLDAGTISGRIVFGTEGASTIVDDNLVTTSTLILGNGIVNNAGLSGGGVSASDVRMWAGSEYAGRSLAPFRVTQDGKLYATDAEITGNVDAASGSIGGLIIAIDHIRSSNDKFSVAEDGTVVAEDASIKGNIEAETGKIGGILIADGGIKSENEAFSLDDEGVVTAKAGTIGGIVLEEDSIHSANNNFGVTATGDLTAKSGTIGGLVIASDHIRSANDNFSVDDEGVMIANGATIIGNITAESGLIGGIEIEANGIKSSNDKFSVNDAGALVAQDATIKGTFRTNDGAGQKIEIESETNSMSFTDDVGDKQVEINTGILDPSGNPIGAGIGVGKSSAGYKHFIGADGFLSTDGTTNAIYNQDKVEFFDLSLSGFNRMKIDKNGIYPSKAGVNYTGQTVLLDFGGGRTQRFVNGVLVAHTGF